VSDEDEAFGFDTDMDVVAEPMWQMLVSGAAKASSGATGAMLLHIW